MGATQDRSEAEVTLTGVTIPEFDLTHDSRARKTLVSRPMSAPGGMSRFKVRSVSLVRPAYPCGPRH